MTRSTIPQIKAELMRKKAFKESYDALEEEFNLARVIIKARTESGLTQEEVAKRMDTTQSVIARTESGKSMPSTTMLSSSLVR